MDKKTRSNPKALIRSLQHIGLLTADIEQARMFYVDMLELDVIEESQTDFTIDLGGANLLVTAGGRPAVEDGAVANFSLNFKVRDFGATCKMLLARGVAFVEDRREIMPGIWFAACLDPDGNRIELMTPIE